MCHARDSLCSGADVTENIAAVAGTPSSASADVLSDFGRSVQREITFVWSRNRCRGVEGLRPPARPLSKHVRVLLIKSYLSRYCVQRFKCHKNVYDCTRYTVITIIYDNFLNYLFSLTGSISIAR